MPSGSSVANVYIGYSLGTLDYGEPVSEEYRNSSISSQIGKNYVDLTQVSSNCKAWEAVSALWQYVKFTECGKANLACNFPIEMPYYIPYPYVALDSSVRHCENFLRMEEALLVHYG